MASRFEDNELAPGQKDPVPAGTAIGTFIDGKYPQNAKGHAAVYIGQNALGI